MIKINLLPVRQIRKRKEARKQVLIFLVSICVVLAGLGITGLGIAHKISSLKKEVATLQQKKASYQPMLNEINKLKKDKQEVEKKLQIINGLKKGKNVCVKVLDEVASRTPVDRLWLKSLTQSPNRLRLSGIALDNSTIADYMENLEKSPLLGHPDLSGTSQVIIAGKKLKSFSLTLSVIKPENRSVQQGKKGKKK